MKGADTSRRGSEEYSFWLRSDAFRYGLLPLTPDSNLTYTSLQQLAKKYKAVHELSSQYFKTISYEVPHQAPFAYLEWKTVGTEDLRLTEVQIQALFERFKIIKSSRDNRWRFTEPNSGVIHFYEFLLFLSIQRCNVCSFKDPNLYRCSYPRSVDFGTVEIGQSTKHQHLKNKFGVVPDDVSQLFIQENLYSILSLLCDSSLHSGEATGRLKKSSHIETHSGGPPKRDKRSKKGKRVSKEAIDLLISPSELSFASFILGESNNENWPRFLPLPQHKSKYRLKDVTKYILTHLCAPSLSSSTSSSGSSNSFRSCPILPILFPNIENTTLIQVDPGSIPKAKSKLIVNLSQEVSLEKMLAPEPNIFEQLANSNTFSFSDDDQSEDQLNPLQTTDHSLRSIDICNALNSFIYFLLPLANVLVKGCRNCTIVLGAVGGLTAIEECHNCTIIATTRALQVLNSTSLHFNLLVTLPPLLIGDNRALVFGPYNTFYASLQYHLDVASITTNINQWNKPSLYAQKIIETNHNNAHQDRRDERTLHIYDVIEDLGFDVGDIENLRALHRESQSLASASSPPKKTSYLKIGDDYTQHVFSLQDPRSFVPFSVPVVLSGPTTANPYELSEEYKQALAEHSDRFQRLSHQLQNPEHPRDEIKATIFLKYQEWLKASGNLQQIEHIVTHQLKIANFPILDFKPKKAEDTSPRSAEKSETV